MAVVVTNKGFAIIANRMMGSGTSPKYSTVGTGGETAVAASNTALGAEDVNSFTGNTRVTGTESRVTTTQTNDTYQVTATHEADAAVNVDEAGLFDAVSGGDLFLRGNYTEVVLGIGDSIALTYKVKFS